jgi:hypothetical protein
VLARGRPVCDSGVANFESLRAKPNIMTLRSIFGAAALGAVLGCGGGTEPMVAPPDDRGAQLHAINIETLAPTIVATAAGGSSPFIDAVVLSDDGTRAAYRLYESSVSGIAKIYVANVN